MSDQVAELSVKVATVTAEFNAHMLACNRRYEEDVRWKDRLFSYIRESTEKTDKKIDEAHKQTAQKVDGAVNELNTIKNVMAEARGAGKLTKFIGHGISVLIGGGAIGVILNFFHH